MKNLVLLTNDDGIESAGLSALADALSAGFDVVVAAPDRERSGVSHGLTLRRCLKPVLLPGPYPRYSIDGTPVDCVKLSVHHLLPRKPDFVVSGINRGANVGVDVLYSGTVGGALEGAVQGIRSVAVSVESMSAPRYAPAAGFAARLLATLDRTAFPRDVALNVNFPDRPVENCRGVVWARQEGMLFRDRFRVKACQDGSTDYELVGAINDVRDLPAGSDAWALREGYVTVTPVSIRMTSLTALKDFQASLPSLESLL